MNNTDLYGFIVGVEDRNPGDEWSEFYSTNLNCGETVDPKDDEYIDGKWLKFMTGLGEMQIRSAKANDEVSDREILANCNGYMETMAVQICHISYSKRGNPLEVIYSRELTELIHAEPDVNYPADDFRRFIDIDEVKNGLGSSETINEWMQRNT